MTAMRRLADIAEAAGRIPPIGNDSTPTIGSLVDLVLSGRPLNPAQLHYIARLNFLATCELIAQVECLRSVVRAPAWQPTIANQQSPISNADDSSTASHSSALSAAAPGGNTERDSMTAPGAGLSSPEPFPLDASYAEPGEAPTIVTTEACS